MHKKNTSKDCGERDNNNNNDNNNKKKKKKKKKKKEKERKDCRKVMRCVLYMLFILCLNPIAWTVRATEGYRLSKPISTKITHLLYIEDIKLFAASEDKVKRVMTVAKNGMESTGLKWNKKKCAVINVKRGQVEQGSGNMKIADLKPIKSLDQHNTYKFLGVFALLSP